MLVAVSASGSTGSPSTVAGRCSSSDRSTTTPPDAPSLEDGAGARPAAEATSALEARGRRRRARATGRLVGPLAPQAPDTMATSTSAAHRRHGRPRPETAAAQMSSRRMTGNRSSAIARANPAASQKAGRRGARGVRPGVRPPGRPRRPRSRASRDRRRRPATRRRPRPSAAGLRRRRDAGDDRGQRRGRQARIQVARLLGPRIGGQRPELAVRRGHVVAFEDLRVAAGDAEAAGQQLELARRVGLDRGPPLGRRRERVRDGRGRRRRRGTG